MSTAAPPATGTRFNARRPRTRPMSRPTRRTGSTHVPGPASGVASRRSSDGGTGARRPCWCPPRSTCGRRATRPPTTPAQGRGRTLTPTGSAIVRRARPSRPRGEASRTVPMTPAQVRRSARTAHAPSAASPGLAANAVCAPQSLCPRPARAPREYRAAHRRCLAAGPADLLEAAAQQPPDGRRSVGREEVEIGLAFENPSDDVGRMIAAKARWPVSNSYSTQPKAQISARVGRLARAPARGSCRPACRAPCRHAARSASPSSAPVGSAAVARGLGQAEVQHLRRAVRRGRGCSTA